VPLARRSWVVFAGIGVTAGFFSALFGVGGGVIVVPMLILLMGYESRPATGTSLAVIGLTAAFGVASFSTLGKVHWTDAAIVGLPAMVGTLAGTWVQQRVSSRFLLGVFAAFLFAVAVRLFVE